MYRDDEKPRSPYLWVIGRRSCRSRPGERRRLQYRRWKCRGPPTSTDPTRQQGWPPRWTHLETTLVSIQGSCFVARATDLYLIVLEELPRIEHGVYCVELLLDPLPGISGRS
ncbi:hypothetical protein K466DRAFT_189888 [Polyporus arcularius HHB13444]|uniref:Uncharacterized protein n=1 Tax=Polyporus arcularius HHB13444 TaxID=1314778 RepID=A0A5C3P909_9APHY|nr:hypothetical protein K466DRAFT_189888 [Polyporus arcularius HHB13444]